MKFAHMADCHLGSWSSHPDMREYPIIAFEKAIDQCIAEDVDFIIIAGDLLDTSLPGVDVLSKAAAIFHKCREADIPVYLIAGSHDYSPTGKTMLSVFESAGLVIDVAKYEDGEKINLKFTTDRKTGTKLTGIFGRKGSLEIDSFKKINIPEEDGDKIFVFHCGIDEHSAIMGANYVPVSLLPGGFDYYATGHIHIKKVYENKIGKIGFPGPLFPTSFDELENYDSGFYIVEKKGKDVNVSWRNSKLFDVVLIKIDVTGKSALEVEKTILENIESKNLDGNVLLLKLHGNIEAGKLSDINFNELAEKAHNKGARVVKRSTSAVTVKEFEKMEVKGDLSIDQVEKGLIEKHAEQLRLSGIIDIEDFVSNIMNILKEEKGEDETNASYEEKIKANAKKLLEL
ncbi:MAG TPA: exonuclease SbcCD subunit D [archaeon]|nr:exonuclease SbcCD subunit D [archaeon]